MPIQRCGKAWFELSKVVLDDYGPQIGAHGFAIYAYLVRHAEDSKTFEFEDLEKMLGLKDLEVSKAFERLIDAGVMVRETVTNEDGSTTVSYNLIDLVPQYHYSGQARPPFEAQPELIAQPIPEKNKPTCKGFVYIVEGGGYFKIGCTTNLSQRIKALTVKAPFTLDVRVVIPSLDIYGTELELHRRFAKKHRRGEWFDLDLKDIEDVRNDYPLLDPAFLTAE